MTWEPLFLWVWWQWRGWFIVIEKSQGFLLVSNLMTELFLKGPGPFPVFAALIVLTEYALPYASHLLPLTNTHIATITCIHSSLDPSACIKPLVSGEEHLTSHRTLTQVCSLGLLGGIHARARLRDYNPDDKHSDPFWPSLTLKCNIHTGMLLGDATFPASSTKVWILGHTVCKTASKIGSTIWCATIVLSVGC